MGYVQRKFYIPEDAYAQMSYLAESEGKTITDVLRSFIDDGLKKKKKKNSAGALLKLAKAATWKGEPDLSINHDKYFVEAYDSSNRH